MSTLLNSEPLSQRMQETLRNTAQECPTVKRVSVRVTVIPSSLTVRSVTSRSSAYNPLYRRGPQCSQDGRREAGCTQGGRVVYIPRGSMATIPWVVYIPGGTSLPPTQEVSFLHDSLSHGRNRPLCASLSLFIPKDGGMHRVHTARYTHREACTRGGRGGYPPTNSGIYPGYSLPEELVVYTLVIASRRY